MFEDTSFQSRLQSALDDTVKEFNRTRDPDGAIAKCACDYGFTPAGTQRLVETFNRARTIFHFNTSDDKTAGFKLADPEEVAKLMYSPKPAEVKTASAIEKAQLDAFYDSRESDYVNTYQCEFSEKVAEAPVMTVDNLYPRIQNERTSFTKGAEAATMLRDTAQFYADSGLEKLARSMLHDAKDSDILRTRFGEFKEACRRDELLAPVIGLVEDQFGPAYKLASVTGRYDSVMDTADIDPYIDSVTQISGYLQKVAFATAVLEGIEKDSAEFEASVSSLFYGEKQGAVEPNDFLIKRGQQNQPRQPQPPQPPQQPQQPQQQNQQQNQQSGGGKQQQQKPTVPMPGGRAGLMDEFIRGVGGYVGRSAGGFSNVDLFRATTGAPLQRENKELTSTANNVHRQLLLEDLMTNDPVLSEADPAKVINAYQLLITSSPEVANQKPTVAAILRQVVHGQDSVVSPYDVDQWARLNTALKIVRGGSSTVTGKASPTKVEVKL